jgi:thiamine pyrophosphokinase
MYTVSASQVLYTEPVLLMQLFYCCMHAAIHDLYSFLLLPGYKHLIKPITALEGPICGLIPLGGPCDNVTTKGLRWNLHESKLAFGSLVSSSNMLDADEIEVTTDAPLVWTIEFGVKQ